MCRHLCDADRSSYKQTLRGGLAHNRMNIDYVCDFGDFEGVDKLSMRKHVCDADLWPYKQKMWGGLAPNIMNIVDFVA